MRGWKSSSLGDVVAVMRNGLNCDQDKGSHGQRVTRIETISRGSINLDRVGFASLNPVEKEKYRLSEGDILFSHINSVVHVGKTALVEGAPELYHGTNLMLLRSADYINPKFLNYYMKSLFSSGYWRTKCKQSVNQASVNQTDIKAVPISYPPLPEQRRIVAILDEAIEGLAVAAANTEKNLKNAGELLRVYRSTLFHRLASEHKSLTLGTVCSFENGDRGKNYPGKAHRTSTGVPFINAGHLGDDGLDMSSMDYISPERFAMLGNGKIQSSDILFCLRGSLGKFASVGGLSQGAIASSLVIVRPKQQLRHAFLLQYLDSSLCSGMIAKHRGGTAQPNLGAKDLKRFLMPLPSLEQQDDISRGLESLTEQSRRLRTVYGNKLYALAQLKQSILNKAFSGGLTSQFSTTALKAIA
jgi:type I restriction enzyme, S subunit